MNPKTALGSRWVTDSFYLRSNTVLDSWLSTLSFLWLSQNRTAFFFFSFLVTKQLSLISSILHVFNALLLFLKGTISSLSVKQELNLY